jgi:hypothetical protein
MIGKTDSTLFTRKMGKDLFICQIYIDDIIFSSTNKFFYDEFNKIMTDRFEMFIRSSHILPWISNQASQRMDFH